ncbi:MAG: fimbrial biogenesis outer membrane usher protein, partial [Vibrionaceae bacterium]|nr:fimbrial biogenesis outer membrane usher protein [Vibrionaceae bacterium]
NNYYHRLESALSAGPASIEYEASFDSSAESNEQYVREGTRLNIDFPSQGTRLVLGDMYNSGKLFQDGTDVLGIGLTRDFTLIPTRNVRPKAAQSFTLQRTSSVDVVIDGAVVQRLTLSAGSYNLSDIPLAQGNNDVELIITDSAGREERISFSIATGNGLLAQGEFEYSIMAGMPSEFRDGEIKYLSDQQILHGYLDVGITPSLTLGVDAQSREDLYQYGASILHASTLGVTELVTSQSHHPELKSGDAYRLSFDAEFDDSNDLKPQLSFIYEYQSEDFVGINSFDTTDSPVNATQHYASLFGSIAITQRLRTALTSTYSSGVEETSNYWSVSPSLSGPLFGTPATWSTRLNYRDYQDTEDEFSASFTISWPFSRELRAVGQYSSQNQQGSLDVTYRDGIGSTGGVSAYASLETNKETDGNLNAGVNYTGNRFETLADHTTRVENFDESSLTHNTRVEVSSSIAFAGSAVTIGRPVKEAFAVIEKHPSLAENRVAVDPTLNSDYARVFSESSYDVLLPDLVAYNSQLIGYDVEDLPPGYDLGDGAFSLYPGYNRGYRLLIGSDAVLTAMGKIYDRKSGEPITLVAGKAIYLGDKEHEPVEFFTNRQGLFALSGLRPGDYKLELDNKEKQSVTVNLPEDGNVLVMLGDLYVD